MLEPATGEHVLMQAVLVDAIKNLTGRSSSLDARDAYAWVKSRDRDWAYSFERICEMLDVDAAALRRRLLTPPSPRPAAPTAGGDLWTVSKVRDGFTRWWNEGVDQDIRRLRRQGWTTSALAERFGLSATRIERICRPSAMRLQPAFEGPPLSAARSADHGERSATTTRHRVLVIEDDADLREAMIAGLEHAGYEVIAAADGRMGLDLLQHGIMPRVILLDLMLPVMDGRAFRHHQLADPALASIPVIVVSADPQARDLAGTPGVYEVLAKPVDLDTVLRLIARICAG